MTTRVIYLGGGLAGVEDSEVDRPFLVRLEEGRSLEERSSSSLPHRLAIGECHFFNGPWGVVTRDALRKVGPALDRVEAHLNSGDRRERLIQRLLEIRADSLVLGDGVPTLEEAWLDFLHRLAEGEGRERRRRLLRLTIPDTKRFPDSFYEQVRELYLYLVREGERPVPAIAEANGVERSTVYTWVREARARGLMSPTSRAGKAG